MNYVQSENFQSFHDVNTYRRWCPIHTTKYDRLTTLFFAKEGCIRSDSV